MIDETKKSWFLGGHGTSRLLGTCFLVSVLLIQDDDSEPCWIVWSTPRKGDRTNGWGKEGGREPGSKEDWTGWTKRIKNPDQIQELPKWMDGMGDVKIKTRGSSQKGDRVVDVAPWMIQHHTRLLAAGRNMQGENLKELDWGEKQ